MWYSLPVHDVEKRNRIRIIVRNVISGKKEAIIFVNEDDIIDWAIRRGNDYKILAVYDNTGVYFSKLGSSSDLSIEDLVEYYTN